MKIIEFGDAEVPSKEVTEHIKNLRCKITGNICGTDTWEINHPCQCENCQKDLTQPNNK